MEQDVGSNTILPPDPTLGSPRFSLTKVKTGLGKAERDFLSTKPISQEISYFSYLRMAAGEPPQEAPVHLLR